MSRILCILAFLLVSCQTTEMPEPEPKPQPRGQLSELEMMELIYEIEALEESKIYRLETAEEAAERRRKRGLK